MIHFRPLALMALSSLMGLSAVVLAAGWLKEQGRVDSVQVVVARRDLPMGTRLEPDMLESVAWPAKVPPAGTVTLPELVKERVIMLPVLRGEPIVAGKLAAPGERGGLSSVLATGRRAVTVKVNEVVGVAGFALPGNYVDVMVHVPDRQDRPVSKIVLERILVLAVAQDVTVPEHKPRVVNAVTLEVTPAQAEQLDLARSVGTLSLVLRSQSDEQSVLTSGARKPDLIRDEAVRSEAPARAARAPRPASAASTPAPDDASTSAQVIRGLKVSSQ